MSKETLSPFKGAIERIKYFFSKEKYALFSQILSMKEKSSHFLNQDHTVDYVKSLKASSTLEIISLKKLPRNKGEKKKRVEKRESHLKKTFIVITKEKSIPSTVLEVEALHTYQCCTNENHPLLIFQNTFLPDAKLHAKRVKRVVLKEQLLASRQLEELVKEKQEFPKTHTITHFEDANLKSLEEKGLLEQNEQWMELIKNKEERQFDMGRVIKYLSK